MTGLTFDERYRAIAARDARFDGWFVTAVRTTGIYCRPSCPARTPRPGNVVFLPTSAAAHEAGYRACKRCLPEAAPGSPEWRVRGDVAARALRLVADGVVDRDGVGGLARRLGYSSRHLTRILTAELGAGPLALARAQRAHTARMLLVDTAMPLADVAFAAGFASVRQFNDTVREVFDLTPTALRARRRGPAASAGIDLVLPLREPFDAAGLFAWFAPRALAGVEEADAGSLSRTLRLPRGAGWFRVSFDGRLRLSARLEHPADLAVLVARVRRLLDLDADPEAVDAQLAARPELRPLVRAAPGIRLPGASDPHEMLMRAMVGQQISVAAARTHLDRLVAALGEEVEPDGVRRRLFPTAEAVAARGRDVLRGPARRIDAIVGAAEALASGALVLTDADDPAAQRAALLALPGVGPWTADYVRMRVLGDPDVLPDGDLALRAGARAAGIPDDRPGLRAWAAGVAPWRSYAAIHLWRRAAEGAAARRPPSPASRAAPIPARRPVPSPSAARHPASKEPAP